MDENLFSVRKKKKNPIGTDSIEEIIKRSM
jgi:hypothetical protein